MSIELFCMFDLEKVTRKNGSKIDPEKLGPLKVGTVAKVFI